MAITDSSIPAIFNRVIQALPAEERARFEFSYTVAVDGYRVSYIKDKIGIQHTFYTPYLERLEPYARQKVVIETVKKMLREHDMRVKQESGQDHTMDYMGYQDSLKHQQQSQQWLKKMQDLKDYEYKKEKNDQMYGEWLFNGTWDKEDKEGGDVNFRSRKLLDLARDRPCTNCGAEDGTVVPAHSNQFAHGKGASIKAHDCFFVPLCIRCHSWLDQGTGRDPTGVWNGTKQEKQQMFDSCMHDWWLTMWRDKCIQVK